MLKLKIIAALGVFDGDLGTTLLGVCLQELRVALPTFKFEAIEEEADASRGFFVEGSSEAVTEPRGKEARGS